MTARLLRWLVASALVVATASCGSIQRLRTGGASMVDLPYNARLSRGEGRAFTVAVASRGAGIDAVRELVRFPATRHCMRRYGGSDAVWRTDAGGEWLAVSDGNRLRFAGRCTAR